MEHREERTTVSQLLVGDGVELYLTTTNGFSTVFLVGSHLFSGMAERIPKCYKYMCLPRLSSLLRNFSIGIGKRLIFETML